MPLEVNEFNVAYTGGGLTISGSGIAFGIFNDIQNLPFGLAFSTDDDISFDFLSNSMSNVMDAGGFLTSFAASGSGSVRGVLVPEPVSATMLLMAGLGLVGFGRRRR